MTEFLVWQREVAEPPEPQDLGSGRIERPDNGEWRGHLVCIMPTRQEAAQYAKLLILHNPRVVMIAIQEVVKNPAGG